LVKLLEKLNTISYYTFFQDSDSKNIQYSKQNNISIISLSVKINTLLLNDTIEL